MSFKIQFESHALRLAMLCVLGKRPEGGKDSPHCKRALALHRRLTDTRLHAKGWIRICCQDGIRWARNAVEPGLTLTWVELIRAEELAVNGARSLAARKLREWYRAR